ncbi:cyanophycinase [bacterium]|nr:cyanophycinase [bacterium]
MRINQQNHYTSYFSGNPENVQSTCQGGAVLMGGGTDVDEAFQFLVERGGGGDILILRASGADGYNDYLMDLAHPNSVESVVFKSREASFAPEIASKIDEAEAIFLAGGDQAKYCNFWKDTPVQQALQRAVLRGVPIGGTSAGLAVLGERIFSAQQGGLDPQEVLQNPCDGRITIEDRLVDLPFMDGILTDTHFSQRERMGRLAGFLAHEGGDVRGLGVDEATAVLVTPDGKGRVVGSNSAYFVTPPGPAEVCEPGKPLTYRDLKVLKVDPGGSVDLRDWQAHQRLDVIEGQLSPSAD